MNTARSLCIGENTKEIKYSGITGRYDGKCFDFSEELEIENAIFSTHMEVCGLCEGRGVTTAHVECDGGGFTSSEWSEQCNEDPDFASDYMSGKYDRPCPECDGSNVVPVINDDNDPELLAALQKAIESEHAYQSERYYERMVGA